jgi:hypothetical protein
MVRSLFFVALVAFVTKAVAGDITYNIVDYSLNETDISSYGGTDTISGTIVTDGTIGPLTKANIVGGSFTLFNSTAGSITSPISGDISDVIDLEASTTQLTLPPGGGLNFLQHTNLPGGKYAEHILEYQNDNTYLDYFEFEGWTGFLSRYQNTLTPQYFGFSAATPPAQTGSISDQGAWVIASAPTVPEPATLSLLGTALLGLSVVYLRRRGAQTILRLLFAMALLASAASAQADVFNMGGTISGGTWTGLASLQFVTVGDPGNLPDPNTGNLYGSVNYTKGATYSSGTRLP